MLTAPYKAQLPLLICQILIMTMTVMTIHSLLSRKPKAQLMVDAVPKKRAPCIDHFMNGAALLNIIAPGSMHLPDNMDHQLAMLAMTYHLWVRWK